MKETFESKRKKKTSKISKAAVKKALIDSGGVILPIAKRTGYAYATLHVWIHKPEQKDIRELLEKEKMKFVDLAEIKLMSKVNQGADWAVKYTLSTLGKKRGYVKQFEIDNSGTNKIEIEFKPPTDQIIDKNKTINVEAQEVEEE